MPRKRHHIQIGYGAWWSLESWGHDQKDGRGQVESGDIGTEEGFGLYERSIVSSNKHLGLRFGQEGP